jgi:multidrug efflux pump subunit AcrA (membrane-fusion protein)
MTIHAPIDGRVFELVGHPGTTMAGNMQHGGRFDSSTVITLYQPEWLQVRVDVRFEDLPLVQNGQPVQIRNAALPAPLPGKVLLIGSLANMQKNTQETLVVFDQPPEVLKPQMLMDITFLSPQSKNNPAANQTSTTVRLYVPSQLVQDLGGTPFVWVADQTARVARRVQVELGAGGQSDLVEIRQGLNRTSRLIATGWETLQDGSRISVLGEAPATNPATRAP